jgi:hypothetical protein
MRLVEAMIRRLSEREERYIERYARPVDQLTEEALSDIIRMNQASEKNRQGMQKSIQAYSGRWLSRISGPASVC